MKKIKNKVSHFIIFFLLIVVIWVVYAKYVRKDRLIKLGKYAILVVLTESMEPTIEATEVILIKEQKQYEVGDIVTYLDLYGNFITHRIVQLEEYTFMAKGDKNQVVDDSMKLTSIQGKVMHHSKIGGIFVLYYLKPLLFICFVLYFLLIFTKNNKGEIK